ncbi:MAG: hypothetical protein ACKERG_00805 [Candidatus Hodgkinia cicadicola]
MKQAELQASIRRRLRGLSKFTHISVLISTAVSSSRDSISMYDAFLLLGRDSVIAGLVLNLKYSPSDKFVMEQTRHVLLAYVGLRHGAVC